MYKQACRKTGDLLGVSSVFLRGNVARGQTFYYNKNILLKITACVILY